MKKIHRTREGGKRNNEEEMDARKKEKEQK